MYLDAFLRTNFIFHVTLWYLKMINFRGVTWGRKNSWLLSKYFFDPPKFDWNILDGFNNFVDFKHVTFGHR